MGEAVPPTDPPRTRRAREGTAQRREEILRAAASTFGSKGYNNGSLVDVAEQVGITHAGVLHHFGTKERLLTEVLTFRDREQVAELEGHTIPGGIELFRHLIHTARLNAERPGFVQTYTVLTGEAVTDGHPARAWAVDRFAVLRGQIAEALTVLAPDIDRALAEQAASAVIGVMDGLQIQWLLTPDEVDLPESTTFAIEAIVAAALAGPARPTPVPPPAA